MSNMNMNHIVGIIGAMDSELSALVEALQGRQEVSRHGLIFHSGKLNETEVVLVKCGIGKVNAARCTQILIDTFQPAHIINTGIAGGLKQGLRVGDVVIATGLVQHDFDVTAFGHVRGYLCTGEDDKSPTIFHTDKQLSETLADSVREILGADRLHRGIVATGDQFISSTSAKASIAEQFDASAAEMEGGAIAQVASLARVPFAVVRTISDLADGTAPASYASFEEAAAHASARCVIQALQKLAVRYFTISS